MNAAEKAITEIIITTAPTKLTYREGEIFDPSGMEITAKYNDGTERILGQSDIEIIGSKISRGENVLTIAGENYVACELIITGLASENTPDNEQSSAKFNAVALIISIVCFLVAAAAVGVVVCFKKKKTLKK